MAVRLIADNHYVHIKGASRNILRKLERELSYRVVGFQFSPAFQQRRWDGREHLLKFSRKHGYRVPIGLLAELYVNLRQLKAEVKVIDKRRRPIAVVEYDWNPDVELRPHQNEAVDAITGPVLPGRGILKMPIRSGKTWTVANVIKRLKARTLVIVNSQLLLYQTRDALNHVLMRDGDIGVVGDSGWVESDITVATIHTLVNAREAGSERYKKMLSRYDMVVFDECHHLRGDVWREVMIDFDAFYKVGLSATVYLDNEREMERGVIWLRACCGEQRCDIPASRLIREGWLVRPTIKLYRVLEPDLSEQRWSMALQNEAVYENEARNQLIVQLAQENVAQGLRVLIICNRLNQIGRLKMMLDDTNLVCEAVTSKNKAESRRTMIQEFVDGHIHVLVGTVFGEGVDIPEVECVINAEGGRDVKATVQRMRNLTPNKGKTEAVFIDFMDMTNKYFAEHSRERLKVYRSEPEFNVKLMR